MHGRSIIGEAKQTKANHSTIKPCLCNSIQGYLCSYQRAKGAHFYEALETEEGSEYDIEDMQAFFVHVVHSVILTRT